MRAKLPPGIYDAVDASYELFDHTADIGIRVRAASLSALVEPAGAGLYAAIGELAPGEPVGDVSWDLEGDDAAVLLRDYLTELLVLFERDQRMLTDPDVTEYNDNRLSVRGLARRVDERRSVLEREVKAVTYHELAVRPIDGGLEATFIVDI